ncbi:MAG: hypothetical protein IJT16_03075 [Lachnospiraceae bacterium]|nr:hypothetical protein [Lachnospiraceae bacterium]
MRLRFYLRGLGLGIIVTALLMGYTLGSRKQPMTDEEIIAKASELGMVEEGKKLVQPASEGTADEEPSTIEIENPLAEEEGDTPSEPESDSPPDDFVFDGDPALYEEEEPESDADLTAEETQTTENTDESANDNGNLIPELSVSGTKDGESSIEIKSDDARIDADNTESGGSPAKTGTTSRSITVRNGDDSIAVAKQLEKAGVVENAEKFDEYLVGRKLDRYISSGSFKIPQGASDAEIAKILTGR